MTRFTPITEVQDDGLIIPEVREWSIQKYRLLGAYCDIFTTSMKGKWKNLIYIDLFAGAGYSKIKESGKILKSSSLIAGSIPFKFTHYIFCEQDEEKFHALSVRAKENIVGSKVDLINGDSNKTISQVRDCIPRFSRDNTGLCFCFVDPFSLNLDFSTIKELGQELRIDFLILLALGMDANRNLGPYLDENNNKIAQFINDENWREEFEERFKGRDFMRFLSQKYDENMVKLNYVSPTHKHPIRSNVRNLSLYHLAFYSKHPLGNEFWKKIRRYGTNQTSLF